MPVALNVDGLERKRKKWNRAGARPGTCFRNGWPPWLPNAVVTRRAGHRSSTTASATASESVFIPYGAETGQAWRPPRRWTSWGWSAERYFLYVSRMEPENNALLVREAFERVETPMKLALIGDAPYAARLHRAGCATPGPAHRHAGRDLRRRATANCGSHCFAYIHATEVGGTHPALIEAMGRGALTLYLNTPENAEVAGRRRHSLRAGYAGGGDAGGAGDARGGARCAGANARRGGCAERYSWDAVTDAYEALLVGLARRRIG